MKYTLCLMILCFVFPGFCKEPEPQPSEFSVETAISSDTLDINQQLILQMTITYPSTYHPNIDLIRRRLVQNAGLYEPPFALAKDEVHPRQETKGIMKQQIDFILSPQTVGKHNLSAGLIQFDPNSKGGKKVDIASDLFTIDVNSSKVEVNLHSLIEPPMTFSTELPIVISQGNRRAHINNPLLLNEEAEKNAEFIKSKAIPWLAMTAALAVMLVIAFTRLLPARNVKNEADPLFKEKIEAHIREDLQGLALNGPKDAGEIGAFITRLDYVLRRYLLNKYDFPAFSFTTQELEKEIDTHEELLPEVRKGMVETFRAADQVKFAKQVPSRDEFVKLLEMVKQLLS